MSDLAGRMVLSAFRTVEDERQNPTMPQSTKERQEALRARRAMLGMTEVRGIYLPPELHSALKEQARILLKRAEREQATSRSP